MFFLFLLNAATEETYVPNYFDNHLHIPFSDLFLLYFCFVSCR